MTEEQTKGGLIMTDEEVKQAAIQRGCMIWHRWLLVNMIYRYKECLSNFLRHLNTNGLTFQYWRNEYDTRN